jgi:hypothetical protein
MYRPIRFALTQRYDAKTARYWRGRGAQFRDVPRRSRARAPTRIPDAPEKFLVRQEKSRPGDDLPGRTPLLLKASTSRKRAGSDRASNHQVFDADWRVVRGKPLQVHPVHSGRINDHFEGTRDYIVTHYKTNTRRDTDYWRACAENKHLSDSLRQLYALWMSGRGIAAEVGRQAIGKGYPIFSWYCIMCGMGIFPDRKDLRAPTAAESRYSMEEIDNLLARSAQNFEPQRALLANIPRKVNERALQIYFW